MSRDKGDLSILGNCVYGDKIVLAECEIIYIFMDECPGKRLPMVRV